MNYPVNPSSNDDELRRRQQQQQSQPGQSSLPYAGPKRFGTSIRDSSGKIIPGETGLVDGNAAAQARSLADSQKRANVFSNPHPVTALQQAPKPWAGSTGGSPTATGGSPLVTQGGAASGATATPGSGHSAPEVFQRAVRAASAGVSTMSGAAASAATIPSYKNPTTLIPDFLASMEKRAPGYGRMTPEQRREYWKNNPASRPIGSPVASTTWYDPRSDASRAPDRYGVMPVDQRYAPTDGQAVAQVTGPGYDKKLANSPAGTPELTPLELYKRRVQSVSVAGAQPPRVSNAPAQVVAPSPQKPHTAPTVAAAAPAPAPQQTAVQRVLADRREQWKVQNAARNTTPPGNIIHDNLSKWYHKVIADPVARAVVNSLDAGQAGQRHFTRSGARAVYHPPGIDPATTGNFTMETFRRMQRENSNRRKLAGQ